MEEVIRNEKEICRYLEIPNIPKKKWDGKTSFKRGIGVVSFADNSKGYVVATFDEEKNDLRIIKVFSSEPFNSDSLSIVSIVPEYMDMKNIDQWDVDEKSKENAQALVSEIKEKEEEQQQNPNPNEQKHVENEWVFDEIHNREEAEAWLKSYRKANKITGYMPKTEEAIKSALYVIYTNTNIATIDNGIEKENNKKAKTNGKEKANKKRNRK